MIDPSWPGALVVLSGPSGVGKTALTERLIDDGHCVRAITATTRRPREGEVHGVDYFFYESREAFRADVAEGKFLEHAEVHERLYGTPLGPLSDQLRSGETVVLNIDVQGVQSLLEQEIQAHYVFIEPPSLQELERRLTGRGSEDAEALRVRLENARWELQQKEHYQHRVTNDDFETAVQTLARLLAECSQPGTGASASRRATET